MRAVRLWGERDVRVEDVPEPEIVDSADAIIRVTATAICGSDLHLYHWRIPGFEEGGVPGHEFVGVVEEVGSGVANLAPGDRVVASMFTACGRCPACLRSDHIGCPHWQMFGYGMATGDLQGGQAERVRIPFADMTLAVIPDDVSDEQALFLSDILPTGYLAADMGNVGPGDTVAVIGCGPVGLFALSASLVRGAAKVLAVDRVPDRLALAKSMGGIPVDGSAGDPMEAIWEHTGGLGADVVIEAVGSSPTIELAMQAVKNRGTVSVVGVFVDEEFPLSVGEFFLRNLSLHAGLGMPLRDRDLLLPLIRSGRLDPAAIITHRLSLEDAKEAYDLFDRKEALKVVLQS